MNRLATIQPMLRITAQSLIALAVIVALTGCIFVLSPSGDAGLLPALTLTAVISLVLGFAGLMVNRLLGARP